MFFHELGHFIAAKLSRMRVEEFAFGFGPRLVTLFKKGNTEYTIHAFPLGGFVKITGMEPGEEDIPDGFQAQPIWKRALVIFAGPLFSFILAVLVFQFVNVVWGFQDASRTLNKVLQVNPHTIASGIGLRAGDTILEINGKKITNGSQMLDAIHGSPGKPVRLLVKHNDEVSTKTATPRWAITYVGVSWSFMNGDVAEVEDIADASLAKKAGIEVGDRLVSINGRKIVGGDAMDAAIRANRTNEAAIDLLRDGKVVHVRATPMVQWVDFAGARWYFPGGYAVRIIQPKAETPVEFVDQLLRVNGKKISSSEQLLEAARAGGPLAIEVKREREPKPVSLTVDPGRVISAFYVSEGRLGFLPQVAFKKMDFVESVQTGWRETILFVEMMFGALKPSQIGKNVGGPLMIAKQTSMTVDLGPYYVVKMAGMLSMSLAVINLFPIPLFDGGHLALLGIEAIRRRRLTREQMQWVSMVGFAIIIFMVVGVFFSDISKLIGGQVPQ